MKRKEELEKRKADIIKVLASKTNTDEANAVEKAEARLRYLETALHGKPTADQVAEAATRVRNLESLLAAISLARKVSSLPQNSRGDALPLVDRIKVFRSTACSKGSACSSLPESIRRLIGGVGVALRDEARGVAAAALKDARWPAGGPSGMGMRGVDLSDSSAAALRAAIETCTDAESAVIAWESISSGSAVSDADLAGAAEMRVMADVVAEPLTRRFAFHFRGNLPTAAPDKLHWALQFVLDSCKDSSEFIERFIQPSFKQSVIGSVLDSLVASAADKIVADLSLTAGDLQKRRAVTPAPDLQKTIASDTAILDAVTEVLWFDSQAAATLPRCGSGQLLCAVFSPPPPSAASRMPSVASSREGLLQRWVRAEWKSAVRVLDDALHEVGPWSPDETSDGAPTVCACVLDLVQALSDRYSALPSQADRSTFVAQVQAPLLQRFLHEVTMARTKGCGDADIVKNCTLACACIHCEDTIWELTRNGSGGSGTESQSLSPEDCQVFTGIARQFGKVRKDLLGRTVAIAVDSFGTLLAPLLASTAWGISSESPNLPNVKHQRQPSTSASASLTGSLKIAYASAHSAALDVSDVMADALDNLRRHLRLGTDSFLTLATGSGRLLAIKFARRACEAVNSLLVAGLVARKRMVTEHGAAQFALDVDTVLEVLCEFDSQRAPLILAPILTACSILKTGEVPDQLQGTSSADSRLITSQTTLDRSVITTIQSFRV